MLETINYNKDDPVI